MSRWLSLLALAQTLVATLAVGVPARAQTAPSRPAQPLAPPPADVVQAALPLARRGAVALVDGPDRGPGARTTLLVPVAAPAAVVRQAIADAERWPEFIPAVRAVELLSRHGRRAAYRFLASASVIEATAICEVRDISPRRVDFVVLQSDFGPAGARWDLYPNGPDETLVAVTTWSDPAQGHWLLRRTARIDPSATAGMTIAAELTLALAVARRASTLAGRPLPVRPARAFAPVAAPAPPPPGAWLALVRRYYVVAFGVDADGAVTEVTAAGETRPERDRVLGRLADVAAYPRHLGGIRASTVAGAPAGDRFHVVLDGAWEHGEGDLQRRVAGDTVWLDGVTGALDGVRWRWDMVADPLGGTVVMLTGAVDGDLANLMARVATSREPYLAPGLTALRRLVWIRQILAGI